jgi:hypothetical protein
MENNNNNISKEDEKPPPSVSVSEDKNADDQANDEELNQIAESKSQQLAVRSTLGSLTTLKSARDSFEENIRPDSPSQVSSLENVESVCTKDGEKIKIVRTVKEIHGSCPKIGAREAVGTQLRETTEKIGKGLESYTDFKTESIVGNDGTKLTRTTQASRVKYSYGSRSSSEHAKIPPTSLFATTTNSLTNQQQESSPSYLNNYNLKNYVVDSADLKRPTMTEFFNNSTNFKSFTYSASSSSAASSYKPTDYRYEIKADTSSRLYDDYNPPPPPATAALMIKRETATIEEIVPPTFSYEIENYTIKKGETAYFKGTVNGSYPFEVTWYLDNDELKTSSRIEMTIKQDYTETFLTGLIDYIVSLKILNCSYEDIGKYTVFVKNKAGDASCSAFLIIEGK